MLCASRGLASRVKTSRLRSLMFHLHVVHEGVWLCTVEPGGGSGGDPDGIPRQGQRLDPNPGYPFASATSPARLSTYLRAVSLSTRSFPTNSSCQRPGQAGSVKTGLAIPERFFTVIGGGAARELADQQGAEGKGAESTKEGNMMGRLAKGFYYSIKGLRDNRGGRP